MPQKFVLTFAVVSLFGALFATASFATTATVASPATVTTVAPAVPVEAASSEKTAYRLAKLFFAARIAIGERTSFTDDPANGKQDKAALLDGIRLAFERIANQPLDVQTEPRMRYLWQSINLVIDKAIRGDYVGRWKDHPNFPGRLIPARFGTEITEAFNALTKDSSLRWTTSDEYLVNPLNKSDAWETTAMTEKFKSPTWQQGEPYFELVKGGAHPNFRYAMPEYFKTACMNCHGGEMGKKMHRGKGAPGSGTFGGILSVQLRQ